MHCFTEPYLKYHKRRFSFPLMLKEKFQHNLAVLSSKQENFLSKYVLNTESKTASKNISSIIDSDGSEEIPIVLQKCVKEIGNASELGKSCNDTHSEINNDSQISKSAHETKVINLGECPLNKEECDDKLQKYLNSSKKVEISDVNNLEQIEDSNIADKLMQITKTDSLKEKAETLVTKDPSVNGKMAGNTSSLYKRIFSGIADKLCVTPLTICEKEVKHSYGKVPFDGSKIYSVAKYETKTELEREGVVIKFYKTGSPKAIVNKPTSIMENFPKMPMKALQLHKVPMKQYVLSNLKIQETSIASSDITNIPRDAGISKVLEETNISKDVSMVLKNSANLSIDRSYSVKSAAVSSGLVVISTKRSAFSDADIIRRNDSTVKCADFSGVPKTGTIIPKSHSEKSTDAAKCVTVDSNSKTLTTDEKSILKDKSVGNEDAVLLLRGNVTVSNTKLTASVDDSMGHNDEKSEALENKSTRNKCVIAMNKHLLSMKETLATINKDLDSLNMPIITKYDETDLKESTDFIHKFLEYD